MQSSTGAKWKLAPVIISGHLYIFKVLHISRRFYSPSAFIFRVLLFSESFYFPNAFIFPSAFIFRALSFSERFYFPSALISRALLFFFQALLFLISKCKPALTGIFYSSKYETVSNFCFKTISWSYFFIIFWIILNMLQMLVLIMYKTSRFWPLV